MPWKLVKVTGSTLCNSDGSVLSLNPNSQPPTTYHWSDRPAGTNGPFEQMAINGGIVCYNPTGIEAVLYRFQQSVPNTAGFSAMDTDREP